MRTAIAFLMATVVWTTSCFAVIVGDPHLHTTAFNLGGGFIQYTVNVDNAPGGAPAAEITAQGNFNQIDANVPVVEGGTGMVDPVDTFLLANVANVEDANYLAAGGSGFDSWWSTGLMGIPNPPFFGITGGEVGSTLYQFSLGSSIGNDSNGFLLGQFVVFDAATVDFPAGALDVVPSGLAEWRFMDSVPGEPSILISEGGGEVFNVNESFAVIPEPSTLALAGFGLIGLLAYGWRRRRRA